MKTIVFLALGIVVACILATGCETKKDNDSENISLSPTNTFTTFAVPGPNITKGQLTISIGGLTSEYPVSVDKRSVGVVTAKSPITLMIEEGNHTVEVCCGRLCKQENVTIKFGKKRTVDLSEQFKEVLEFSEPTVRITDYLLTGDQITVDVEFVNPTTQTLTMSADISCGYTYIDSRSNNRAGNSAQGRLYTTVNRCDRTTQTLNLNLASGSSYHYDIPTITRVSSSK